MAQGNAELVREMLEASRRGDWPAAIAAFHPDVELDQSRMPDGGVYLGADEVWSFYRRWFGSWAKFEMTPRRVVEVDAERVLVLLDLRAEGRETGIEVTMRTANLYTIRDGRIVRAVGYPDHRDALQAVGLRE